MTKKSGISWTDATWNPVTGCTKVSEGCKHCYAEREVEGRWSKNPKSVFFGRSFTDVQSHKDQLAVPMKWKKPHRIFVCPRADLFHESVPFEFIAAVFGAMSVAEQHTFQVLTKRPERMLEFFDWLLHEADRVHESDGPTSLCVMHLLILGADLPRFALFKKATWPLHNVHLGVTIENQAAADERISLLLATPAAVRWISAEPLIGPVTFRWASWVNEKDMHARYGSYHHLDGLRGINWIVAGGESGPNARPMHPDWARNIRDQCEAAGVPFLFKQFGEWTQTECKPGGDLGGDMRKELVRIVKPVGENDGHFRRGDVLMRKIGTKSAGRLLDGVLHDDYPELRGAL
jgi:protein gp37